MALPLKTVPTIEGRGATAIVLEIADPNLPDDIDSWKLTYQTRTSDDQTVEEKADFLAFLEEDLGDGSIIHKPAILALLAYTVARIDTEAYSK